MKSFKDLKTTMQVGDIVCRQKNTLEVCVVLARKEHQNFQSKGLVQMQVLLGSPERVGIVHWYSGAVSEQNCSPISELVNFVQKS